MVIPARFLVSKDDDFGMSVVGLFATPSSVFEISATFVFSCGTERCKSAKSHAGCARRDSREYTLNVFENRSQALDAPRLPSWRTIVDRSVSLERQ